MQRALAGGLLSAIPVHDAAHGSCARRSVLTAVTPHSGQPMVIAFDLQKFFPSIRASRVHALFRTAGYPRDAARVLTGLCTTTTPDEACRGWAVDARPFHRTRHVPQGAPTSPAIANLSAYGLDRRLNGLAKKLGAYYTRYADDLLFSGPRSLGQRVFAELAGRVAWARQVDPKFGERLEAMYREIEW